MYACTMASMLNLVDVPLSSSSDSMFRVMSDILTGKGFLKTAVIVASCPMAILSVCVCVCTKEDVRGH